jgi:hypothetical protein
MPKTAGDATFCMLTAVPGLVTFADGLDSHDKHMPFFGRESEVAGKLLVMNIRRLPNWVLSGAHHRATHGLYPDYRPLPLQAAEELCVQTDPDDLLRWMTDHNRYRVARWVRAEALQDDVLSLLAELGVADEIAREAVGSVGRVNEGSYDRDVDAFFTGEQIATMYDRNPGWAAAERRAYCDGESASPS